MAKKTSSRKRPSPKSRTSKSVYFFGSGRAAGRASMRNLLGGKGANLAEMTRLGVPVPAGFTISTRICSDFYARGRKLGRELRAEVLAALGRVEKAMEGEFGSHERPLLVSVRSGARVSMPGMMDTVLNLGLNDDTVEGLVAESGDRRFAFDSYRRFVQMYGDVVLGIEHAEFESLLEAKKRARGVDQDTGLDADDLAELVAEYKAVVRRETGADFPDGPLDQLWGAIAAVFDSWNTPRAITYRKLNAIDDSWGTAVNVQAMVFGNLGDDSATGVAFTRDPSTGERDFFGEFLPKAQGEDVVAGIRTPQPISSTGTGESLEELMPKAYRELRDTAAGLEKHYRDMQDLEFTIQRGRLWMLQTRNGKRTGQAAVRIAVEMVRERLIDKQTALGRVDPEDLNQLLHPMLDPSSTPPPIGEGLAASPGAACGSVVFSADAAVEKAAAGEDVILVRRETSPEDIHGMTAAQGILTELGGKTSHAAVVARGMGKCCVCGCSDLEFSTDAGSGDRAVSIGGVEFREGDVLTIDGSSGYVFKGSVPTIQPQLGAQFKTLMGWADRVRNLKVRTNADTPGDAELARRFGAEGIGLCRTEHMFFQAERLLAVRRMILSETVAEREAALEEILPMQRDDFVGIFTAMSGLPVTIRLLDPPLHEFLPHGDDEVVQLAKDLGVRVEELRRKVEDLREFNPMLGHRGCRLAITYPEIYRVQTRAIIEAASECLAAGVRARPEIMVPLVGGVRELRALRDLIDATAAEVMKQRGRRVRYSVGTMIEVPRAALNAGRIADVADFFSFGTNDLTQMTMALSRDDSGRFLPEYIEKGILSDDPFVTLDIEGVGELVRIGVQAGRRAKPDLKIGICGEHGGDPRSIAFCHANAFDYVSCSPFRVPIARLAGAQAALASG
jgi:pyruvate,orthophosphate dikinase